MKAVASVILAFMILPPECLLAGALVLFAGSFFDPSTKGTSITWTQGNYIRATVLV